MVKSISRRIPRMEQTAWAQFGAEESRAFGVEVQAVVEEHGLFEFTEGLGGEDGDSRGAFDGVDEARGDAGFGDGQRCARHFDEDDAGWGARGRGR